MSLSDSGQGLSSNWQSGFQIFLIIIRIRFQ